LIVDPHVSAGSAGSEGIVDGLPTAEPRSPNGADDFAAASLAGPGPGRGPGRDIVSIMNRAVRGRRLASPVRLALANQLGSLLDGAWWPHSSSLAAELPELVDALSSRLGEIIAISINWSSLESSPDLDAVNRPRIGDAAPVVGHQRLMMVAGSRAGANLLVVPCRTSAALATMLLRQAAALPIMRMERDTKEFRASDGIVRAARTESARCGRHAAPAPDAVVAD
jgi:hypothetical protein